MCAWRQCALFFLPKVLAEQLQELFGVLPDQLGNLGVASGNLLQDRLQHLRLLLHELSELLEMGVGAQEVQVGESIAATTTTTSSSATAAALAGLGSRLEHIETLIAKSRSLGGGRSRGSGCWLLLLGRLRLRLRFRLLGDTLAYR